MFALLLVVIMFPVYLLEAIYEDAPRAIARKARAARVARMRMASQVEQMRREATAGAAGDPILAKYTTGRVLAYAHATRDYYVTDIKTGGVTTFGTDYFRANAYALGGR